MASLQRKHNVISSLMINGSVLTGVDDIRQGIREVMVSNFKQEGLPHITLPRNAFKKFSAASVFFLDEIPTSVEIK